MSLVDYILGGIFVIFVAIMSFQHHPNRGKSIEQRREETYEQYVECMEKFQETKTKEHGSFETK